MHGVLLLLAAVGVPKHTHTWRPDLLLPCLSTHPHTRTLQEACRADRSSLGPLSWLGHFMRLGLGLTPQYAPAGDGLSVWWYICGRGLKCVGSSRSNGWDRRLGTCLQLKEGIEQDSSSTCGSTRGTSRRAAAAGGSIDPCKGRGVSAGRAGECSVPGTSRNSRDVTLHQLRCTA